jgi:hypothetical protein
VGFFLLIYLHMSIICFTFTSRNNLVSLKIKKMTRIGELDSKIVYHRASLDRIDSELLRLEEEKHRILAAVKEAHAKIDDILSENR